MMIRRLSPFAVAVGTLLLLTAPASAQRRVVIDSTVVNGPGPGLPDWRRDARLMVTVNRRQRLGVVLNMQPSDADTLGALVTGVTPRGPASKAGIRSGDIIVALDGESLVGGPRPASGADGASLPASRLVELAAKLAPNDTVSIRLLRGNESKTVSLVTGDDVPGGMNGRPMTLTMRHGPDGTVDIKGMEGVPRDPSDIERLEMLRSGPGDDLRLHALDFQVLDDAMRGLEVAPLNADLGAYFGTTEGVLVITAPRSGGLGLKGGDVVLAIDGRRPSSPANLMRILGSYDKGDTVKLEIMRNRHRETVTGKVPGRGRDGEEE